MRSAQRDRRGCSRQNAHMRCHRAEPPPTPPSPNRRPTRRADPAPPSPANDVDGEIEPTTSRPTPRQPSALVSPELVVNPGSRLLNRRRHGSRSTPYRTNMPGRDPTNLRCSQHPVRCPLTTTPLRHLPSRRPARRPRNQPARRRPMEPPRLNNTTAFERRRVPTLGTEGCRCHFPRPHISASRRSREGGVLDVASVASTGWGACCCGRGLWP